MPESSETCPGCGAEVARPAEALAVDPSEAGVDPSEAGAATASDLRAQEASARPRPAAREGRGMSAITKAAIAAGVAFVVAGLLIFWQLTTSHARPLNLTPEDMALIAESASPQQRMALSSDAEARQEMAKNIREFLAIADEARSKGFEDRAEVRRQLDTMKHFVVAQTYALKQREGGAPQGELFTKEEVEGFLKGANSEKEFEQVVKDAQATGLLPPELDDTQKEQIKQQWGTVMVLSRKGTQAGVDKDRKTQLQVELQRAKVLAELYAEDLAKGLQPTDAEVDAKMAEARREAEDVLKRARGGEDFEALAKQHSDEPGASERGGDLGWFGRGQMVKEFEETAFAMKEGDVSDVIETQFGFHVIKVEGRRNEKGADGKDEEQVKARHILIRPPGIAEPNRMAAPKSLREQVKDSIARERQEQRIKEIVERSKVQVPTEFAVKAPEMPKPPAGSPHGEVPMPPPADDGHGHGAEGQGAEPERK
ncbi:MAG TPA: peptidylprolyl isomerase [Pyrinomonadaceae bacterium]|nr:peptidylprolyl isomerase [Pyrinomonadaceae bacterium]